MAKSPPLAFINANIEGDMEARDWIRKSPLEAEKAIAGWIAGEAPKLLESNMRPFLHVSEPNVKNHIEHKPHAKYVKRWYTAEMVDPTAVRMRFSKKQWYLRFPETGTGTSRHRGDAPVEALAKGAEASVEPAIKGMLEALEKALS